MILLILLEIYFCTRVKWLFREITYYGVTGDPAKAISEKGIMMWDALVNHLVAFIDGMDNNGWEVDKQTNA